MKKHINFLGEYEKRRFSCREEGVLMLKVNIEYPIFEGDYSLYKEMAENCERWVSGELLPKIKTEYESSSDEQKKFRFPSLEYTFSVNIQKEEADKYTVLIFASLKRRGRVISESKREHFLYRNY